MRTHSRAYVPANPLWEFEAVLVAAPLSMPTLVNGPPLYHSADACFRPTLLLEKFSGAWPLGDLNTVHKMFMY